MAESNTSTRLDWQPLVHNASVLFYGPANTSHGCSVDRCRHDVVIITNNMFTLLPPDPCPQRRILVVNRFYSHVLEAQFANRSFASHFHGLSAVLCTDRRTCERVRTSLSPLSMPFASMATPAVQHGLANTLQFVLKALRGTGFRTLHVTGVTFYEGGQSYVGGYGLTTVGARHDQSANKAYALQELRNMGPSKATIDYPTCNASVDALGAADGLAMPRNGTTTPHQQVRLVTPRPDARAPRQPLPSSLSRAHQVKLMEPLDQPWGQCRIANVTGEWHVAPAHLVELTSRRLPLWQIDGMVDGGHSVVRASTPHAPEEWVRANSTPPMLLVYRLDGTRLHAVGGAAAGEHGHGMRKSLTAQELPRPWKPPAPSSDHGLKHVGVVRPLRNESSMANGARRLVERLAEPLAERSAERLAEALAFDRLAHEVHRNWTANVEGRAFFFVGDSLAHLSAVNLVQLATSHHGAPLRIQRAAHRDETAARSECYLLCTHMMSKPVQRGAHNRTLHEHWTQRCLEPYSAVCWLSASKSESAHLRTRTIGHGLAWLQAVGIFLCGQRCGSTQGHGTAHKYATQPHLCPYPSSEGLDSFRSYFTRVAAGSASPQLQGRHRRQHRRPLDPGAGLRAPTDCKRGISLWSAVRMARPSRLRIATAVAHRHRLTYHSRVSRLASPAQPSARPPAAPSTRVCASDGALSLEGWRVPVATLPPHPAIRLPAAMVLREAPVYSGAR